MPRAPRSLLEDQVVHVLNRGNQRQQIFHRPADYDDFVNVLEEVKQKAGPSVELYAVCLMPNHFHAVMHARRVSDLGAFMNRWLTSYARRHHAVHSGGGHLFQGRYGAFPVQSDVHLETVIRYVLLNPVKARLVRHVQNWRWSSLQRPDLVDAWPIPMPGSVLKWLAAGCSEGEASEIQASIRSSTPYGLREWCERFRATVSKGGREVPF